MDMSKYNRRYTKQSIQDCPLGFDTYEEPTNKNYCNLLLVVTVVAAVAVAVVVWMCAIGAATAT